MWVRVCSLWLFATAAFPQGLITTVAGTDFLFPNRPIPATAAPIGQPGGIGVDQQGTVYFVDQENHAVMAVDASGTLRVIAGNGIAAFSGDGGPATEASLNNPADVIVDGAGNIYISDFYNQRVRKITAGRISTVAGNGVAGGSGDGGLATDASLNQPIGLALDLAGNLFIADSLNHRVRRVSSDGIINTISGLGSAGYSGDGNLARTAQLNLPFGIVFDSAGNLLIADSLNGRVRKVDRRGVITTIAGNGTAARPTDGVKATQSAVRPAFLAVDGFGNLYIAEPYNNRILKVDSSGVINTVAGQDMVGCCNDGLPATQALLSFPIGVASDPSGQLFIGDSFNDRIRRVVAGIISTFAGNGSYHFGGDGAAATAALLHFPGCVAVDSSGKVFIADTANQRVRMISTSGVIKTIAGNGIAGFTGDGVPATATSVADPLAVAVDNSGYLYIVDATNRVRKVAPDGIITTVAGNGRVDQPGDNMPATSVSLYNPLSVTIDGQGNLLIADSGHGTIRKVTNGIITTIAGTGQHGYSGDGGSATQARLGSLGQLAVDTAGDVFFADASNNRVRMIDTADVIHTVAGNGTQGYSGDGGPATRARLNYPLGVAIDRAGSLLIADFFNNRIRRVTPDGIIQTVAGDGFYGFRGDGGPAQKAELKYPESLAFAPNGDLYVTDSRNNRVRKILASPPVLTVSGSLKFSANSGSAPPASQKILISTDIPGVAFTVQGDKPWLTVSPTQGVTPRIVDVTADPTALDPKE